MEYLLDFMGWCGMFIPGGVAIAEHIKGVFLSNLCEVIGHLTGLLGWSDYEWLLQEGGPICLVNGVLDSLRGIFAKSKP